MSFWKKLFGMGNPRTAALMAEQSKATYLGSVNEPRIVPTASTRTEPVPSKTTAKAAPPATAYDRFVEVVADLARTSSGATEFMRRIQAHGFTTAGGSLTLGRIYQLGCIKVVLGVLEHKGDDQIWHISMRTQPDAPIVDIVNEGKLVI